jgi:hypothetical protein
MDLLIWFQHCLIPLLTFAQHHASMDGYTSLHPQLNQDPCVPALHLRSLVPHASSSSWHLPSLAAGRAAP